jgi:WSC domain
MTKQLKWLRSNYRLLSFSVGQCQLFFQGFKYAGAQNGTMCFCGDSYGSLGTSNTCNVKCSGDPLRGCGGLSANIVINTGLSRISFNTFLLGYDQLFDLGLFQQVSETNYCKTITAYTFSTDKNTSSFALTNIT